MVPHAIEAQGLAKSFGVLPVLRGLDLVVESGEAVAIVGPNGAGKSTLLKLLAGISRASAGRLELFGVECHPARPASRLWHRIGFVGHDPLIYPDLTPRENLAHYARMYRNGAHDRARDGASHRRAASSEPEHVDAALRRVGLAQAADRQSRTLSRGMLQRLALARATLHSPDLLLLDEPFTGLDDSGAELLTRSLSEARDRGTTLLLVTHDLARVSDLAARVLILSGGQTVLDAAPPPPSDELARLYRDRTSASIGASSMGHPGVVDRS